ncbi:hypothetical protein FQR65_LT20578 [Abscondita terminalis]|nr:hypothetical protein FQR65_LT20578 [Abscondita terminalis]
MPVCSRLAPPSSCRSGPCGSLVARILQLPQIPRATGTQRGIRAEALPRACHRELGPPLPVAEASSTGTGSSRVGTTPRESGQEAAQCSPEPDQQGLWMQLGARMLRQGGVKDACEWIHSPQPDRQDLHVAERSPVVAGLLWQPEGDAKAQARVRRKLFAPSAWHEQF